jgi:hypothetical protein
MNKALLHAQQLKQDAKCAAAVGMTCEEWLAYKEQMKHESRMSTLPQVDALLAAGWKFELPAVHDSEPWQWYWRRPARRKGSKGRLFLSTNQAFNALQRERGSSNETHDHNPGRNRRRA